MCWAVLVTWLAATRADADTTKAWTTVKDNVSANTDIVLVVDAAVVTKTAAFGEFFDLVRPVDRSKASACLEAALKKMISKTATVKQDGIWSIATTMPANP